MAAFASGAQDVSMGNENALDNAFNRLYSVMGKFDLYGNYTMDPILRSRRELVCQILQMVDNPEDLEVSVAALRIVQDMTSSGQFEPLPGAPHKLYSILEDAGKLGAIREAFMNRLEREEDETVRTLGPEGVQAMIDGQVEDAAYDFGLANIIRLQILDFFIANVPKPGFNLAHYLLGFDAHRGVKESVLDETQDNCLFVILDILGYGLGKPSNPAVCTEHPSLAARMYELVWTLMSTRATNKPFVKLLTKTGCRFNGFLKDHLMKSSTSLIDPSDAYLTAHNLRAKASLFRAVALELTMVKNLNIELSLLIDLLKAAKAAIQPTMLSAESQTELAASLTDYINSLCKLLQVFVHLNKACKKEQLILVLLNFIRENGFSSEAREPLSATLLTCLTVAENTFDDSVIVSTIVGGLCQNESSLTLRGYLYACFSALPRSLLSRNLNTIKSSCIDLIEVVSKDISAPGGDLDAWKTLAITFLSHFCSILPSAIETLSQLGYLRSLVRSLRSDEASLHVLFSGNQGANMNSLYLWKAKLNLFKSLLVSSPASLEIFAEADILDHLSSITVIDRDLSLSNSSLQRTFEDSVEALLSLVVLIARCNSEHRHASIHQSIINFIAAHFDLLARHLSLKTGLKAASPLLEASASLIDYVGPELVPVAAKHGINLRQTVANLLVKSMFTIESETLDQSPSKATELALELCAHSLQFVAASRIQSSSTATSLVDFDGLALDQLNQQGKLPIQLVERLLAVFSRAMAVPAHHTRALKAFEQLVFIILLDLEHKLNDEKQQQQKRQVFIQPPTGSAAQELSRTSILKYIEAFNQYAADKAPDSPLLQACKRWTRQLAFLIRPSTQ